VRGARIEERPVLKKGNAVTGERKVIVNIATSADGYIARPDGNLDCLTRRPPPTGLYGMASFMRSIDVKGTRPEDL